MRSLMILSLAVAASSASILPIRFTGNGKQAPSLRGVSQCPGHENDMLVILPDSTSQENICMPGETIMNMHTQINADMPNDLTIHLDLKKLEPFPMKVPCLNGIGSCPYDICALMETMADTICPALPASQPCHCPLLAGEMMLSGMSVPVPDMGLLGELMEGKYEATATFYSAASPDNTLGCVLLEFSLERC